MQARMQVCIHVLYEFWGLVSTTWWNHTSLSVPECSSWLAWLCMASVTQDYAQSPGFPDVRLTYSFIVVGVIVI